MTTLLGISLITFSSNIVLAMLGISILLSFIRLVCGPSLPDRVIALDLIATLAVGAIAVHSIAAVEPIYLLVAIVLALIAFLGTVAFAYYVAKGGAQ